MKKRKVAGKVTTNTGRKGVKMAGLGKVARKDSKAMPKRKKVSYGKNKKSGGMY
jgi:hypothetical protein